jgi:DNA repair exonuclease SbcCD ATPase subunit
MTPSEHDKRQAESDAGMEQWAEHRPERLRRLAEEILDDCLVVSMEVEHGEDIAAAADELVALRSEVGRLRGEVDTARKVIHDQADEIQNLRSVHREIRRKAEAFDKIVANVDWLHTPAWLDDAIAEAKRAKEMTP